jgi:TolA-binding protein
VRLGLFLALLLAALAPKALLSADEAEVVDSPVAAATPIPSDELPGWKELAPQLSSPTAMAALDAYLKKYPRGAGAARAQLERGARLENLEEAAQAYRQAMRDDSEGRFGREAAVELGKLEYAAGHVEAALTTLEGLPEEGLDPQKRGDLVFWRAQARLQLKGVQRAQDEFEGFLKNYPGHPMADEAALAVADCDALMKNNDAALEGYRKLYQDPPSSVAAQALWQAAALDLRLSQADAARGLLDSLLKSYPDSFEATAARKSLANLGPAKTPEKPQPQATPEPAPLAAGGHFTIQVGAYVRHSGALLLFKKLKKAGYPVRMDKRVIQDNVYHLVQIGRYSSKAKALKASERVKKKEQLPASIVEIP